MDLLPVEHVEVDGVRMAYRECGTGAPVVLVHGNPTSSYLWRRVQPSLGRFGRIVAPDLVGMGASARLDGDGAGRYRFEDHRRWFAGFLEAVGATQRVVLVGHDWGGALALDWASRHPGAVRGLALTETIVRPRAWSEESDAGRRLFRALRGPDGERLVLHENLFVEKVLPGGMLTSLAPDDHDAYRAPFPAPGEGRRAMLDWPREIPFDGEPADVDAVVTAYRDRLRTSAFPKLFVRAEPGAILTGDAAEEVRSWPAVTEVTVPASHFVPEDAPEELTAALLDWLPRLG
jgi:haloalkane dehalogenase